MRIQRACLSTTYVVDSIVPVTSGGSNFPGDYIQLTDGGNPPALLRVVTAISPFTVEIVNSPQYTSPPINPVKGKNIMSDATPTFTVTVKNTGCCTCSS
jgi:hypothetical protein